MARHFAAIRMVSDPVPKPNNTLRGLASLPVEIQPA
jgi:hypothetical protein